MSMVVICPSRGRPGNVAALAEAWSATGAAASLTVYVDNDDAQLPEYERRWFRAPDYGLMIGPRRRLGPTLNDAALGQANAPYPPLIVGFMGDDHRPRTAGWDRLVAEAMQPMGVVYGNDLLQGEALPTAVFLDAEIVRRLGYMVPPGQLHLYLDDYWRLLGESLGTLTYLPDVVIEHVHPVAGKASWDDGYRENNAEAMYEHDRAIFERYRADQLDADLEKLR